MSSEPEPEITSVGTAEPELTSEPHTEPELTFEPSAEPELTYEPTTEPELTYEPSAEPELTYEPTAEPEITYEPTAEPELTSIANAEPELSTEPETEPGAFPESFIFLGGTSNIGGSKSWPEPEPRWSEAFNDWGAAWPLHVYIFGLCYTFAFIFATVCILSIIKKFRDGKGKLTMALLVMVLLFNVTRAISLFTDPYYAFNNINFIIGRIIWSVGLPFLTSSFSLVFLVLLDTTKMDIGPPKFQRFSAISIVTGIHITIVVTSDFVVFYNNSAKVMLVFCQGLFLSYGLTLAIGYLYVGIKMKQNCAAGSMHESKTITRLIVLCFVSSATSAAIVATHIYSAVGVFGVYSSQNTVDSWPWWILQTFLRTEELISVCVVLTIASNSEQLKDFLGGCCRRASTRVKPISLRQDTGGNVVDLTRDATMTKTTGP